MHKQYVALNAWFALAISLAVAASGCQSLTMRGQDAELMPFPEAQDTADSFPNASPTTTNSVAPKRQVPETVAPVAEKNSDSGSRRGTAVKPPSSHGVDSAPARSSRQVLEAAGGFSPPPMRGVPTELNKTSLPTYIIEPPDILLIDAVKLVPKPPYLIQSLDLLQIVVVGTLLGQDIAGQYVVDPSGNVDLGPAYGKVNVAKQSIEEATKTIDTHLRQVLREPDVSVVLSQSSGMPIIAGEHLVAQDGTVNLGTYGSVFVAGMTLAEAKDAVELQLGKYLKDPRISLDVFAFNSKVFYIVSQGAGLGDGVTRVPLTGNETVLDAISQVNGLSRLASKKIWIARPTPGGQKCDQIMPVNWDEITAGASTATNYQVLPGDRVFIAEDKLIAFDSTVTKVTAPFERIFGFSLLGSRTIQTYNQFPLGFRGSNSF
jgi:polysaccharide export outer membrane protein